jgi:hypothetical protein
MRDQLGAGLTPNQFLENFRLYLGEAVIASLPNLPNQGSSIELALADLELEPGETVELRLVADIQATAPAGYLELRINQDGIVAVDANAEVTVAIAADIDGELPLSSGLTLLQVPPRELMVSLNSRLPTVLTADGEALAVCVITLLNTAAEGAGPIYVTALEVFAADRKYAALPIGGMVKNATALIGGAPWATRDSLTAGAEILVLSPEDTLALHPGQPLDVELSVVLREDPIASSFRIGLSAENVGVIQPESALLTISIEPPEGQEFPLWSSAGSLTEGNLQESYSNFPNPFAAGRESTRFVFYLPQPASVTLDIWTARGERVARILDAVPREAGLHQDDAWDGRNGRGLLVNNDVFIAELVVNYDSGSSARELRKVAVIR